MLLLIGATVTVASAFPVLARYAERLGYATDRDGCANVPMAPEVTPQTHAGAILWPYGAVYSCQVLDGGANLVDEPDVSFILLLETDEGPVLTRMDYHNLRAGRQFVAQAVELSPSGSYGLAVSEVTRIDQAIAIRGGLQMTPWIVHYGDG